MKNLSASQYTVYITIQPPPNALNISGVIAFVMNRVANTAIIIREIDPIIFFLFSLSILFIYVVIFLILIPQS